MDSQTKEKLRNHSIEKLSQPSFLDQVIDLFMGFVFIEKREEDIFVSENVYLVINHLKNNCENMLGIFLITGLVKSIKKIYNKLLDDTPFSCKKYDLFSLASALRLYLQFYVKEFFPLKVIKSILLNYDKDFHQGKLNYVMFTIKENRRKLFLRLFNLFYVLESKNNLFRGERDFVEIIRKIFFPNFMINGGLFYNKRDVLVLIFKQTNKKLPRSFSFLD
ncbi:hypothetical protein TUBRATIS_002000 [Tubulinosema ratisbonensis]|uniref:Rho-GAP domain-containing protein n=1 Tax=Tubulinosema ratisbonensis TaxID=291195 RepID=A0A437AQ83_9MICR|nr:hypothetical protein TUBRATIS_002000 [Tubulinosema ratisbonensis]